MFLLTKKVLSWPKNAVELQRVVRSPPNTRHSTLDNNVTNYEHNQKLTTLQKHSIAAIDSSDYHPTTAPKHPIIRIMSLESAKSTLHNLNAKVDAGDVEGGKAILAEMKVSTSKRRNRNPFKSVQICSICTRDNLGN